MLHYALLVPHLECDLCCSKGDYDREQVRHDSDEPDRGAEGT
jgi:hypothetical protein